jgi:ABC-type nitrate/sulfonate/bicarbonate transport system permease component
MNGLIVVGIVLCVIYGIWQFVLAIRNMLAIPKEYMPGIRPWSSETLYNPYNGLIFTRLLNAKGRIHARDYWRSLGRFALAFAMAFALAFLLEIMTGTQLVQR